MPFLMAAIDLTYLLGSIRSRSYIRLLLKRSICCRNDTDTADHIPMEVLPSDFSGQKWSDWDLPV